MHNAGLTGIPASERHAVQTISETMAKLGFLFAIIAASPRNLLSPLTPITFEAKPAAFVASAAKYGTGPSIKAVEIRGTPTRPICFPILITNFFLSKAIKVFLK